MEEQAFYAFYTLLICYRLYELRVAKKNEATLQLNTPAPLQELGITQRKLMVCFHTSWFLSLFIEFKLYGKLNQNSWLIALGLLLSLSIILRYLSMKALGPYWSTKIFKLDNSPLIKKGIYKYFSQPNYFAVVLEFIVIPLAFQCYYTMYIFSLLNLIFLKKRIQLENFSHQSRINGGAI